MTRRCVLWLAVASALACGACKSAAPTGRSHTMLRRRSVSSAAAFAAAEQALGERYRIQVRDPAGGLLRTEPVMAMAPREQGRIGDALRSPRRVRKTVEVRIEPEGNGVAIGCKALVEENQAGAHHMFEREHRLSDIPSDTPADRGAAATAGQEAVWRLRGRDKTIERQICRAIDNLLGGTSASGGGAS